LCIAGEPRDAVVVSGTVPHSPSAQADIRPFDVILSVNGTPVETQESLSGLLRSAPRAEFQIRRLGNQQLDIAVEGIPCDCARIAAEASWAKLGSAGKSTRYSTRKTLNIEPIEVYSDPETDLYGYATYDFEYTDRNTLQQKEAAAALVPLLQKKNLRRDRENPDILIFLEFYSDRRDQYVPPTEQLVTRYRYGWSYGDGWRTRQYIESETAGNYTRTEYLSRLTITMFDAEKARLGSKTPPVIWSAGYDVLYEKRAVLKDFMRNIGGAMLACFPVKNVDRTEHCTYWHTGIVFDRAVAGRVAAVFPGSPAEQAGIRAGERLTSYEPSPAGFDGLRNSFDRVADGLTKILTRHSNYADFQLTRTSGTQYTDKDGTGGGPVKIRTIVGMYFSAARSEAYEKHGNRIEFSVKDTAGKKRKVSLTPIRTTFTEYVW